MPRKDAQTETTEPTVLFTGTFTLYQLPDGGMHLSWRDQQHTEDQHLEVPANMLRMASAMGAGPGGMLGMMRNALKRG